MSMKLNRTARAGQGQVIAVKRANARVIERVVVESAKPFPPRIVRPNPFLEPFFEAYRFYSSRILSRACAICALCCGNANSRNLR
jgi:hypothetical protein